MRDTGRRTRDGRRIAQLDPPFGPSELYRIAYGNNSSDFDDDCCSWCGETRGRMYAYFSQIDKAERTGDAAYPQELYCSLHCWGQQMGYTDL